jgi:hypothetical protein
MEGRAAGHSFESEPSKDIPANLLFLSTRISEKNLCNWNKPHFSSKYIAMYHIFQDFLYNLVILPTIDSFFMEGRAAGHSFESEPSKDIPANLLFLSTRISEKK